MTTARLYLDHNATTPLRPEARAAMLAALDACASASSAHAEGRAARRIVEEAREKVGRLVGAKAENVIFTSSASESNATALTACWHKPGEADLPVKLMISEVEHASCLSGGRFAEVERIAVDAQGRARVELWAERMAGMRAASLRPLASLMAANNETGVVQPVAAVAAHVHAAGGLLHCDAAQAAGKVAVSIADLGADLLTLSSHKLGGPFGAGALVRSSDRLHLAEPLIRGGGQERGLRAGTENLPAIAGFGAAAEAAEVERAAEGKRQAALRDRIEAGLREMSTGIVIFGERAERLPNTLAFADPSLRAETALMALDLSGIAVSSGSACSSGKIKASHVLAAMGVPAGIIECGLRVSLGRTTTAADAERFLDVFKRVRNGIHDRNNMRAA